MFYSVGNCINLLQSTTERGPYTADTCLGYVEMADIIVHRQIRWMGVVSVYHLLKR